MKFGMGVGLKNARNYNADYALEFDGSAEYLQIALPADLAVFTPSTISAGSAPTGWTKNGTPTITYEVTESGSSGCMKVVGIGGIWKNATLTTGKKYKISLRYKSTGDLYFGYNGSSTGYGAKGFATSEWNTITFIITAVDAFIFIRSTTSITYFVESLTIKEDQGFDLNRDQEQILHSKNWDFERTLSTIYASNFSAGVDGWLNYISTSITANVDNIAGENDCLEVEITGTTHPRIYRSTTIIPGTGFIATYKIYIPATSTATTLYFSFGNLSQVFSTTTFTKGAWNNIEFQGIRGTSSPNDMQISFLGSVGEIWYIKDIKTYQIPNLVTNGTFTSNADGWTLGTGWAYGSDKVTKTAGTAGAVSQAIQSVNGKRYRISFEVKDYSAGSVYALAYGNQVSPARTANGIFTVDVTAGSTNTNYGVYCDATFAGSVDNIHIYEIPEWTSVGNHTPNISILDKSGTGTQSLLISASGAGRGSELITNGTFTTDSDWIKGATATTSGGVGSLLVAGDYIRQNITLTPTKVYEMFYTVVVPTGSTVRVSDNANGQFTIANHTVSGTYNIRFTCVNASCRPEFIYVTNGTGTITVDNVSIKEVLGEVTLPSANLESCVSGKKYTIQGEARLDASSLGYGAPITITGWTNSVTNPFETFTSSGSQITSAINTTNNGLCYTNILGLTGNRMYKVTVDITVTSGECKFYISDPNVTSVRSSTTTITSTGVHTIYLSTITVYDGCSLNLLTSINTNFAVNSISIQQSDAVAPTITAQLGTKSVTSSALSIVSGTFTKFVLNFEATASEVSQDLKLWLSGAGSVYVDKLSITQAYDWVNIINFKWASARNNYTLFIGAGSDYIVSTGNGDAKYITLLAANGTSTIQAYDNSAKAVNTFHKTAFVLNRTDKAYQYMNGIVGSSTPSSLGIGKVIFTGALTISANGSVALAGQISHLQIIRFENISLSSFNSAITGLQYPTGGGAEEVLRLTFQDGTSFANTLKDYSPKNHSLSNPGTTMDLTNRKRVV